jgi:DNA-binding MarR family transcriptional regulator
MQISINPLSENNQQLLTEISKRIPERDSWYSVTDLCKRKTEAELTSLSRLLRQLEVQGLVEMRTDNHNNAFVRLSDKSHFENGRLYDVFQISE